MDAKVTWKGTGMEFTGIADKGFSVDMGSKGEDGPTPTEMLLMGLGGCTGMDCILVLTKKKQQVTGFEIKIHGEKAETYPQKFVKIEMEYIFTGHGLDPKKVERAVDLSSNKYCSVKGSLDPAIEFVVTTTVREAE